MARRFDSVTANLPKAVMPSNFRNDRESPPMDLQEVEEWFRQSAESIARLTASSTEGRTIDIEVILPSASLRIPVFQLREPVRKGKASEGSICFLAEHEEDDEENQ
jgi:hypothetical protein